LGRFELNNYVGAQWSYSVPHWRGAEAVHDRCYQAAAAMTELGLGSQGTEVDNEVASFAGFLLKIGFDPFQRLRLDGVEVFRSFSTRR
jgi:hypothetical protein